MSFGEVVIDDFPDRTVVAGSPLHVAVHLRALGWHAHLLTRVGADPDGELVLELLDQRGIDASLVEIDHELPTGRVTVDLAGIKHSFTIHGPAAWDQLTGPRRLPTHDVFCYGTLIGRSEHALGTLQRLLSQTRAFRALDVNLRPPQRVEDALRIGAAEATLIKLSVDELDGAAEILGLRSEPRAFFDHAPRLRWVCITRGPDGAELHDRAGGHWSVRGQDVVVVDTVGAGDAFFAGLIDGLAFERGSRAALETAQARAVATVTQRGGLPPIE